MAAGFELGYAISCHIKLDAGTVEMIRKTTLSDQIREALLERILSGQYEQGDRIIESQIAKEFGVSQSPIREALRDLVAMQFVELAPFKGARVRRISTKEILQNYVVRASLEALAGKLAAPKFKGDVSVLEAIVDQMRQAAATNNLQALTKWDAQFHREIVEATGNAVLERAWNSMMIESWTFVTAVKIKLQQDDLMSVVEAHMPIVEKLRLGDSAAAAEMMEQHISDFAELLRAAIQNEENEQRTAAQ